MEMGLADAQESKRLFCHLGKALKYGLRMPEKEEYRTAPDPLSQGCVGTVDLSLVVR